MNVTKDVITDLLPLYLSEECSSDTKRFVDEFLKMDPVFAEEVKRFSRNPLPAAIPTPLTKGDGLKTLIKTRRLIKRRSYFMAFAIFCSLAPFSFLYNDHKMYWLFSESPASASVYLVLGAAFWVAYFATKQKTRDL